MSENTQQGPVFAHELLGIPDRQMDTGEIVRLCKLAPAEDASLMSNAEVDVFKQATGLGMIGILACVDDMPRVYYTPEEVNVLYDYYASIQP